MGVNRPVRTERIVERIVAFTVTVALSVSLLVPARSVCAAESLEQVLGRDVVVHFVDVGVGDAMLVQLPDRMTQIVIDGGDSRIGYPVMNYIRPLLDDKVELAIITHPDFDHWSGIRSILDSGQKIEELWDPGYNRDCRFAGERGDTIRSRDQYINFIEKVGSRVDRVRRPLIADPRTAAFERGDFRIYVLHSDSKPEGGGDCSYAINNASIVLKMVYGDVSFLLTGDGNGRKRETSADLPPMFVEDQLLALNNSGQASLASDVLKVPHHGSDTASTTAFIKAVHPTYAVISSSITPRFVLPKDRVIQQYESIYFEDQQKVKKVLRTNFGQRTYETRRPGTNHIICATNKTKESLICDYIWNFEE